MHQVVRWPRLSMAESTLWHWLWRGLRQSEGKHLDSKNWREVPMIYNIFELSSGPRGIEKTDPWGAAPRFSARRRAPSLQRKAATCPATSIATATLNLSLGSFGSPSEILASLPGIGKSEPSRSKLGSCCLAVPPFTQNKQKAKFADRSVCSDKLIRNLRIAQHSNIETATFPEARGRSRPAQTPLGGFCKSLDSSRFSKPWRASGFDEIEVRWSTGQRKQ